ncbi:MAG: hypothetical protein ABTQ32_20060 [Myxococcaceae bacterium]
MRMWVLAALLGVTACTCDEKKPAVAVAPGEPVKVALPPTPSPAETKVVATWQQQVLTPTRMELAARVDYGPSSSPITVQLELPPGLQVVRGRTFFTLDPTTEAKSHVEPLSFVSDALPVQDLALVVTGPGVTVREAYKFGRR